jgi:hypothetical protein
MIEKHIRSHLTEVRRKHNRVKINIIQLEYIIRNKTKSYFDLGGYFQFCAGINRLENASVLVPLKTKQTNGRTPLLALEYWLNPIAQSQQWSSIERLKLSDELDLSFYNRNTEWQTQAEWDRIKAVYLFLKTADTRQVVSLEERSFELFNEEKFLTEEGKGFLFRVNLSAAQLRTHTLGEPFVFWLKPGVQLSAIEQVLIVENKPFFHTCVKLLNQNALDYSPDIVIYGEGKKIESSFSFFYDLFIQKTYSFYYVGDMDPEGYNIYARLAAKFKAANILPATSIYKRMIRSINQANRYINHDENNTHRDFFISKLQDEACAKAILALWERKRRIPQEALTIETWGDSD